ncbi:BQ2448_495 [Microbotryum intermedium]|uniref:BQ2448_495 protein n=1 Tax=Microbotryum intermedium TaxID=269621 RepID=A0A238F916_9BASI|nr:BQ2448_495 [Microbotryum intermedium]
MAMLTGTGWGEYVDSATPLVAQGFEPVDGAVYGHNPEGDEGDDSPVFSLGHVQFALSSALHSLSCSSNVLLLCVVGVPRPSPTAAVGGQPPQLIRIDLNRPTEVDTIDLPIPPPTVSPSDGSTSTKLHRVHVDPTGRHVLVSTTTGDNFYVYVGALPVGSSSSNTSRKVKALQRLRGAIIESVSWSSAASTSGSSSTWQSNNSNAVLSTFSTRDILLGTASGQILETCLLDPTLSESTSFSLPVPGRSGNSERYVKNLFTLADRQAVTGLRRESWGKRAVVIATTRTRIYQFVGTLSERRSTDEEGGGVLEAVMALYSSGAAQPKSLELPGEPINSELHFFAPVRVDSKGNIIGLGLPKSVAWLTGPGIYHGALTFPPPSSDHLQPGDGIIESASLVPFPSLPTAPTHVTSTFQRSYSDTQRQLAERIDTPISMALIEWHIVLLYEDKIRVIGLLSDKVVFEEPLDLPSGVKPIRLSTDPIRKTCWMHTDQSIFELVIKDEDRDVWKTYLQRSNWELARKYAKTRRQRDQVLSAEADAYFAQGRYIQSAQCYAQSSKSFEEVVLRFVDKNERDALRYYLTAKLERLSKGVSRRAFKRRFFEVLRRTTDFELRSQDLTQRMMLATWLVEIYLSKINQLEDMAAAERSLEDAQNFEVEKPMIEEDLRNFLKIYKVSLIDCDIGPVLTLSYNRQENLDPITIFDLLESHGREELTLYYASVVGDHERIVTHWVLEENWKKALEALNKQEGLDVYYRFAPVLLRHAPNETVETFMRQPSLDVRRLIPALCAPRPSTSSSSGLEPIRRYLQYSILQLQNTDSSVHNTLLTLYATDPSASEADFLHFLSVSPDDPITDESYYDLDYALRLCRANKRVQASALIYGKMALYESAVDLALEHDDLELAKMSADKPEDDDLLRKKLWLKIAHHVVAQKNDVKTAMKFLESTDLLKIEDVLPFFPDFVVIDHFKEEICSALEGYSAHIERLKEDMDEATRSAEQIKSDIADLRHRFVTVDASEKCGSCHLQLLTRQFYVFPCQHCFHADCLIKEVTKNLSPVALRRMLDLQARLAPSTAPTRARRTLAEDTQNQGLKLAVASVQGLDQLRKLVLPDALLGAIGGAIPGTGKLRLGGGGRDPSTLTRLDMPANHVRKVSDNKESLREALDDLLASSCVLCEGGIASVDREFVEEGEEL